MRCTVVVVVALASACTTSVVGAGPDSAAAPSAEPLIGVAGAGDYADRACQVLLRDVGRVTAGSGFAMRGSRWVFEGRVDVADAALAEGAAPHLLWKAGSDPTWRALEPIASAPVDGKATRFLFHVDDGDLPGPGLSSVGLARNVVRAIPYLALGDARLFDHNRRPADLDLYELRQGNSWRVAEDESVCRGPSTTVAFTAGWGEVQQGPIREGTDLVVTYEPSRLPDCRGAGWRMRAHAVFLPMNVRMEAHVVSPRTTHGGTLPDFDRIPATFPVPGGAERVELWFDNDDDDGCAAYDSDFGANYDFAVQSKARARPDWVGDVGAVLSRSAAGPCDGAQGIDGDVVFSTWARQRAAQTNVCFSVWEPGVTDDPQVELWRALDVQVHVRASPDAVFSSSYVNVAGRDGDDAVYAVDLRALDPFAPHRCVDGTERTEARGDGEWLVADVELYMTVNGVEVRPAAGQTFRVRYEDHADGARVACE
jgi:hypothetical protein